MAETTIRTARHDDLETILLLYRDLFDREEQAPDREALSAAWERIAGSEYVTVFILEEDGIPASSCMLAVTPNLTRGARPFGVIENVVTAADRRGRGHGTGIVRHAVGRAWELGCYKVMLLTGRRDEKVYRLYERAGFRRDLKQAFAVYAGDMRK